MSQFDFGNLESPLSGSNFINSNLEPWRDALHTLHKGPSTPSYAVAGMMWINDSGSPWILNIFDGTDNISVGTVDQTTNVFTPSGVSQAAADISVDNSGFDVFTGDDVQEVLGEVDTLADSLGSAAFTESSDYATAAQGTLADNALPSSQYNVTSWVAYTPTITNFGTVTGVSFLSRRNGKMLEIRGAFIMGTPASSPGTITYGFNGTNGGITLDSASMTTGRNIVGFGAMSNTGQSPTAIAEAANAYFEIGYNPTLGPSNASSIGGSGTVVSINLSVPVSGW